MRLRMSSKSGRHNLDLKDEDPPDQGDLIIDESHHNGQAETQPSPPTYSSNTLAPNTPSPYSESEGLNPTSSSNTNATALCYEQLGHNFSRPSSSALSLLAANSRQQKSSRYYPYLRRSEQVKDSDFSYGGNPSNSLVHSNGIWTPSITNYAPPQTPYDDYTNTTTQTPNSDHNNVSRTGESPTNTMAMIRGHSAAGFLFDMSTTHQHINNNGYHNNTQHGQSQYKVETLSSRPYPIHPHHAENVGESPIPIPTEAHIKNASFTQEQVDTLCDVVLRDRNYEMLRSILNDLAKDTDDSENVLRAKAAVAYYNEDYERLYFILESRAFSTRHHKELQELYQNARYTEAGRVRGRPMGPVDKYRIRRKHSLPRTIWDGESTSYTFKDRDRKLLIDAYQRCQYPNGEVKKELQVLTGLDKKQIDNWFKNRRQRDRPLDEKPCKTKLRKSQSQHFVMTPVSSGGSGSGGSGSTSLIYPNNIPYHHHNPHSPLMMVEESMDIKYNPYNNGGGMPTVAQVKSYSDPSPPPQPLPPLPLTPHQKKPTPSKRSPSKNSLEWAKGAAALVGEKVGKRNKKAKVSSGDAINGDSIYSTTTYSSTDPYNTTSNTTRNKGHTPANTTVVNLATSATQDENTHNFQHQQPYSSMLNPHNHHHHSSGVGVGVTMAATAGWPSWASSSTMGASSASDSHPQHHPPSLSSSSYSSMNILPSLAASFNHHSHHSHHHHHAINPEARIPVI